ncbi:MAG: hypothetical protein ATN33_01090 [Epulopiscium sp. Nele67-Bin001]|nr:MAG: hypothetical protein ATN33_01090 [Epulopiscium sp. Nele67-Bin001]
MLLPHALLIVRSRLDIEISTEMDTTNLSDDDNINTILESAKTSDTVVLAWGKCDLTNLAIKAKVKDLPKKFFNPTLRCHR